MKDASKPVSYKDAGVDIEAADRLVDAIRPLARTTFRKEVLTDIGSFGGIVGIDRERFPDPLLVASTDGVGTKLRIAFELDRHDTIGIDLVAMSVNDVLVHGAEPLFFLDYFATGRLEVARAREVLKGIAEGCRQAGCALIGGETAEMPSFYPEGEYELAGFCVGVVNRDRVLDGRGIRPGDVVLGVASSGLHSNGFSLVRRLFSRERGFSLQKPLPGMSIPLGEELLKPTRIYVRPILQALRQFSLKGLAHITGGGLRENLPRVLPSACRAVLDTRRWPMPEIFQHIAREANLDLAEMLRTFNCGIGMTIVLGAEVAEPVKAFLEASGETVYRIGEIASRGAQEPAFGWIV
jgi:phosphoribosylformylglycinamidine cyclo-ligase